MPPPVARQVVLKVLKVTGTTMLIGAAVGLAMKATLPFTRWRLRKIPGTRYTPLVGDVPKLLKRDTPLLLDDMCAEFSSSPVFKLWFGPEPMVVVRDTQLGLQMLKSVDTRPETHSVSWAPKREREPWGNILVFANGDKWSKGRRATSETVAHASTLSAHVPGLQGYIDKLLRALDQLADSNAPVDVRGCCISMAKDAIVKLIFGADLNCMAAGSNPAHLAGGRKTPEVFAPLLKPEQIEDGWWDMYRLGTPEFGTRFLSSGLGLSNSLFRHTSVYYVLCTMFPGLTPVWRLMARVLPDKAARLNTKLMRGFNQGCLMLIDHWKAQQSTIQQDQQVASSAPRNLGIMPHILDEAAKAGGQQFDDNELLGVIIGALFGGFDTTGNSVAISLYYLSKHPEVHRKAQQEVDQVLAGKVPGAKDLNKLPYLMGFVNEVLRLAPPAVLLGRYLFGDYEHPGGAFKIPKGTYVHFPVYTYHRDPSFWPRPTELLPERHIQPGHEHLAPGGPQMMAPFGAGTRRCPGYRFALLEVRLTLARVLQKFEFGTSPDCPEPKLSTNVVRIPDKVMLKVVRRALPEQ